MQDDSYKIFLNTTSIGNDVSEDLKHFLDYVAGHKPQGIFTNKIAEAVDKLKEHKETRVDYMTYKLEIERQRDAAANEARIEEKLSTAKEMFKDGLKIDKIVQYTKLPVDQVRTIGLQGGYISA